jgi:Zn ribbon nucleic-acid-binding protein
MIKREYYDRVFYLTQLKRVSRDEVKEMEAIIRTFNDRFTLCSKCGAQIRHAQRILQNWLNQQEVIEDVIASIEPNPDPVLVKEANLDIDVDEVEAEKVGCLKCGSKNKTTTTKTTRKPKLKK